MGKLKEKLADHLPKRRWFRLSDFALEAIMGTLLSVAGIAISWAGYQSSLWDGIQFISSDKSIVTREESVRNSTAAGQLQLVDVILFTVWMNSRQHQDAKMEDFYRARFRPEFASAFQAWIATDPFTNPKAASSPFALPEYKLAKNEEAARLSENAEKLLSEAVQANAVSDSYVKTTVILGMVMFFIGIGQQFHSHTVRYFLMVISMLILAIGLGNLLRFPIAVPSQILQIH